MWIFSPLCTTFYTQSSKQQGISRETAMQNSNRQPPYKALAIFDLDHTLTRRDTYLRFLGLALLKRPWRLPWCVQLPFAWLAFKGGYKDNAWLKAFFLKAVVGNIDRHSLDSIVGEFCKKTEQSQIYADARKRITFHQDRSDRLVLASASFDFYVIRLAEMLGFDDVLCTHAKWLNNDTLSGEIDGNNCYGPHKASAVERYLEKTSDSGEIFFYSDHHSDLPVFLLANNPIAINPTPKLRELAKEHQFVIELWQ